MKNLISIIIVLFLFGVLGITINYREDITKYLVVNYVYKKSNEVIVENEYKKDLDISFVEETNNFFPNNKQDLLNIFYTALNAGSDEFTYYCLDSYADCIKDSDELIKEGETLSIINNLVHPYNSYQELSFSISSFGRIHVFVEKQYSKETIEELNQKVDSIISTEIKDNMNDSDKIKAIHDYIINNSVYDKQKADNLTNSDENASPYLSESAYGVLMQGYGICSGFSDAMEIFLTEMEIQSYKISSPTHIWNLISTESGWKHLDLTWDNPVVSTGEKLLLHDFYLIDTDALKQLDSSHHNFDETIFKEAILQ